MIVSLCRQQSGYSFDDRQGVMDVYGELIC